MLWNDTISNTRTSSKDRTGPCQLGFYPDEVIPCHVDHRYYGNDIDTPIYELHPHDGTIFPSIVQLRSAKLQHYLHDLPNAFMMMDTNNNNDINNTTTTTTATVVPIIVPYETGLTESILDEINERLISFNIQHNPITCTTTKPTNDDASSLQRLGPKFFQYVNKNLNWTIEAEIAYYPK
jgi:hypothetical protein